MSTSKQDKKLSNALKGLSGKERRAAEAAAREKKRKILYIAAAAVVAVLVAALLFWDSGIIQRNTAALVVGDEKYSATAVEYYFYRSYNDVYPYASYYGIDTTASLKDQEAYDGTTWYDYLMDSARNSLTSIAVLKQEGEAEGYKMSDEAKQNVEDAMSSLQAEADSYGISSASYLSQSYGRYMTVSYYRSLQEDYYYASDYASYKRESFEVTEDEINDYYAENADSLDTFDFECYLVSGLPETTTDADGNTVAATDEETAAALEAAKQLADQLLAAFDAGDDATVAKLVEENDLSSYSSVTSTSFSSYSFGEWLTDSARKAGDTTITELTASDTVTGYYVLKFNSRTRDDYYGLDVYNLLVNAEVETAEGEEGDSSTSAEAETVYDMDGALETITGYQNTWLANGGTAEEFAKLAEQYSASSNASSGGLTENAHKGSMITLINDWLFGEEQRSVGDYTILEDETNHRYQLVYVAAQEERYYWQTQAIASLQSTKYSEWYTGVIENYTPEETDSFPDLDI